MRNILFFAIVHLAMCDTLVQAASKSSKAGALLPPIILPVEQQSPKVSCDSDAVQSTVSPKEPMLKARSWWPSVDSGSQKKERGAGRRDEARPTASKSDRNL